MRRIDLLDMLTKRARIFRADRDYYQRNKHMHAITEAPSQDDVDAVLTGFINHIGVWQCVDYALYASDLASPVPEAHVTDTAQPLTQEIPTMPKGFELWLDEIRNLEAASWDKLQSDEHEQRKLQEENDNT